MVYYPIFKGSGKHFSMPGARYYKADGFTRRVCSGIDAVTQGY